MIGPWYDCGGSRRLAVGRRGPGGGKEIGIMGGTGFEAGPEGVQSMSSSEGGVAC